MSARPTGFEKWVYAEGRLTAGRYAIEWAAWKESGKAICLARDGRMIELFPDDVGMIFAAMDAAYEDAFEGARV